MSQSNVNKLAPTAFRRAVLLGLIAALLTGFVVATTVTSTQLGGGTQFINLVKETFSDDADVVVSPKRIYKATANAAAVGDTPTGVESTNALPQVNNAITKNHYVYEFEVKEAAVDSWQASENFKIEVYMDDGSTNDLIATLYCKQDTVDDGSVEGVTVTADTGTTVVFGDVFSIIITRQ